MCHEYVHYSYVERNATERLPRSVREPKPASVPSEERTGGLVAVLRGLLEKVRPTKAAFPAE